MVIKKTVVEKIVCDFCGDAAIHKCECCGRDVCYKCARWISRKEFHQVSGGPPILSWFPDNSQYPWEWIEERKLCKDCVEKFKFSMAVLAGKRVEKS